MNIHTRLIGALDAVILGLTAIVMLALLLALINPQYDAGGTDARMSNWAPVASYAERVA